MVDIAPEVCARWRLTPGAVLGDRPSGTWAVDRDGMPLVLKYFDFALYPDWRYPLRVAAAFRGCGWPTPEPVEEPLIERGGAWVLYHRLPGQALPRGDAESRARGRLLAELHAAATETGITEQRGGFAEPRAVVDDPELDRWLRVHESVHPEEGRLLRAGRDATAAWFAEHSTAEAPRSVIHGDFAPWNLLFQGGRLTGLLDFEATHHTVQVADFALSWRGKHDEVLRGYDEVRPLSELEWALVRPAYHAWLFVGLKAVLVAHHRDGGPAPDLRWPVAHLRRRSPLLERKAQPGPPADGRPR